MSVSALRCIKAERGNLPEMYALQSPDNPEHVEQEHPLTLGEILSVLWRRLWVILMVVAICVSGTVTLSLAQTPQYEATARILIEPEQGDLVTGGPQGLQELIPTVVDLVSARPIAEDVIQELDLQMTAGEFLGNLTVQQVESTQSIEVSYRSSDPERARDIANAVAGTVSDRISGRNLGAEAITVTVWERAVAPGAPVSPDPVRNGLLALAIGLLLGLGVAFFLEYLDDSLRSPQEVEQVSGLLNFGIIRTFKVPKGKTGIARDRKGA
jgi:capsular polysaccharide biosynthesis protein